MGFVGVLGELFKGVRCCKGPGSPLALSAKQI